MAISYKIDLIRAGYEEYGPRPGYQETLPAIIDRWQAVRSYIAAWEKPPFPYVLYDWTNSNSDEDKDEWDRSDLFVDASNTECYSARTVAMIKLGQRDSFRCIQFPSRDSEGKAALLWCSPHKVAASIFCISEERELLIFLEHEYVWP